MPTPEESPKRAILAALGAMAGVAVLVGLAVGGVILSLVHFAGIGDEDGANAAAPDSMVVPEYSPTESADDEPGLPDPRPSGPSKSATATEKAEQKAITLHVAPLQATAGGRIDLDGVYRGGAGATLQVQRKEGGRWVDFPVTASVAAGGAFDTYIQTSRTGKSPFRVYDKAAGKGSNVVTVTIG